MGKVHGLPSPSFWGLFHVLPTQVFGSAMESFANYSLHPVCVQALFRTFEAKSIPYFKTKTKT